jgi:hypothetical protein
MLSDLLVAFMHIFREGSLMQLDQSECFIPIAGIPNHLEKMGLKRAHRSIGFRWTTRGVSGIKLRSLKIGGRRYTSPLWLEQFFQQVSVADSNGEAGPKSPQMANRKAANAHDVLSRDGI